MIAGAYAVLWVRQDRPGNDACRFAEAEGGYLIDGSSTDAEWNVLRYRIRAHPDGTTRRVRIGSRSRIFIQRRSDDTWSWNGTPVPEVAGAKDIHLGFTPASLTLPLRRIKLDVGDQIDLPVASLDIERERLTAVDLTLRRTDANGYECRRGDTGETTFLTVDRQGIVRNEAGHWKAQK